MRRALCLLAALPIAACGSARPQAVGSRAATSITMEEIRVEARREGERLVVESYDAQELFDRATTALRTGDCARAIAMYERLLREFPTSRYASASYYNAALCHEEGHAWERALGLYRTLLERVPDSPDAKDAIFRLGGCEERLARWPDAAATFGRALGLPGLDTEDRIEAMARRGSALVEAGQLEPGEALLRDAVAFYRRMSTAEALNDFYVAQAQYFIGEAVRARMRALRFELREEQMRWALEERSRLLLLAQAEYILAIRFTNPHWAAAGGFRIGSIYVEFYEAILDAPVPPELTAEQREIYFDELRRQIRPLVEKAIRVWERTILMSERTGIRNDWVRQTGAELERIRRLVAGVPGEPRAPNAPLPSPPPPPSAPPAQGPFGVRTGPDLAVRA